MARKDTPERESTTFEWFRQISECFGSNGYGDQGGLAFDGHNATDGEHVRVRIGLHAGEAIKDGDDFYGKNVILASRVAGKAVGSEILVSSLLRQLVESSTDAALFSAPRDVELKGLVGAHTVFAVAST